MVADSLGNLGYVDGVPGGYEEDETSVRSFRKGICFRVGNQTVVDEYHKVLVSYLSVKDFEFRFHFYKPTPWAVNGNYFELRHTKKPIKYNSWTAGGAAYGDNTEQDMNYNDIGKWERFTANFNNTVSGVKQHNEKVIVLDIDRNIYRLNFDAILYKSTTDEKPEFVCYNVEYLEIPNMEREIPQP